MAKPAVVAEPEWITTGEAAKILDAHIGSVRRLVAEGRLTSRRLPGGHSKVDRAEVERMAAELVKPAVTI